MISNNTLNSLTKLAYPGITIHYSEMIDKTDKTSITDTNGEISKALSSKNAKDIALILQAIYRNTKFKGELVSDKNKPKLVYNGVLYDMTITNNGSSLVIIDKLNNKKTVIEYKATPKKEPVKLSLQDQILNQFKKKKMTDKEVLDFIKTFTKNIK